MKSLNTIEDDIDRIRLQIYEETKDLTSAQFVDYFNKSAEALAKQYGFKIVASAKSSEIEMETTLKSQEFP